MISIDDLVRPTGAATRCWSSGSPRPVLPTRHGDFTAHGYRDRVDDGEHLALVHGDVAARTPPGSRCWSGSTPSA